MYQLYWVIEYWDQMYDECRLLFIRTIMQIFVIRFARMQPYYYAEVVKMRLQQLHLVSDNTLLITYLTLALSAIGFPVTGISSPLTEIFNV